jgi:hypothetical protein
MLAASLCLLLAPVTATSAKSLSSAQITARLNADRVAHGLPGGVTSNPRDAKGCLHHDRYMHFNGLMHPELRGRRGYSAFGNTIGQSSVLSYGGTWRHGNPYADAPYHLMDLYAPGLSSSGSAEAYGYSCTTINHITPIQVPVEEQDRFYTVPADGGTAPYSQAARELPTTPQTAAGIPATTTTGPYIYLWTASHFAPDDAPLTDMSELPALDRVLSVSLTAPDGSTAPVVVVNGQRPKAAGMIGYGDAMLIPRHPLHPNTAYTMTVTMAPDADQDPQRQVVHTWTFTTTSRALG